MKEFKITESVFKKMFNLDGDVEVPKKTLDQFNLYSEGCILLYEHLYTNISGHKFKVILDGKTFEFKVSRQFMYGDRGFIRGSGGYQTVELYVHNIDGMFYSNYEWLRTNSVGQSLWNKRSFKDKDLDLYVEAEFMVRVFRNAYKKYINSELYDLENKFRKTHGVVASHYYYPPEELWGVGGMSPIRFNGVKFIDPLFVYNKEDERYPLHEYDITMNIQKLIGQI